MKTQNTYQAAQRFAAVAISAIMFSFAVAACSSDTLTPAEGALAPSGVQTNTPADSSGPRPGGGAVAGIRIAPQRISIPVNSSVGLSALPVDASGVPSLALLAGRPIWRVANATIAVVTDSGSSLRGLAIGSTKVYATWGTYKDSAYVDIVAPRDTVIVRDTTRSGGGGTPTPTAPVQTFALTAYIFGRALPTNATDTAMVVQMAGAKISVYKLSANPAAPSDSMSVRTLVQTATADANGKVVVGGLSSGFYTVIATATYAGAVLEGRTDFGPPYVSDFQTAIYLIRK